MNFEEIKRITKECEKIEKKINTKKEELETLLIEYESKKEELSTQFSNK